MIFESPNSVLELRPSVVRLFNRYRQKGVSKLEACGVLMGEGDIDRSIYTIVKATKPMLKDIRKRAFFKITDCGHQKIVDQEWIRSSGKRFYLGFWHTHPESHPNPSVRDVVSWHENYRLNEEHAPSLFFPIVGTIDLSIWEVNSSGVVKMNCVDKKND